MSNRLFVFISLAAFFSLFFLGAQVVQVSAETSSPPVADGSSQEETRKALADLVGQPEVQVTVDPSGQFVDTVMVYREFGDEEVSQVDSAGLDGSIRIGRQFNRESRVAFEREEQTKAQTNRALGDLLPSVAVRANRGYEISEPSVVVDPVSGELKDHSRHIRTDVTLTASQPIIDLPAIFEWRRRAAKERAQADVFRIRDGDAYLATVASYLELVNSRLQADLMRDFEGRLQELLTYIEKRAGAGAASVADMSRVRARSQETVSTRLEQESTHLAAGTEFVRLTNLVPSKLLLPNREDVGYSLLPESYETAVAEAMESNPEIATLVRELEAEKLEKLKVSSQFAPRVDFEYTDTYSRHAGGQDQDQRDKRLMLVVNMNFLRGGKDVQAVIERNARLRELRYRLDDQQRRVIKEMAANYAALDATDKRLAAGYKELDSIKVAVDAMSKRMLSGNQSLLDLLTVYDRYYQVRSRLIDLHVFEMNTVAQLVRLTKGAPWPLEMQAAKSAEVAPEADKNSLFDDDKG